jgi:transcriptional/translational regulatory protein YebC/TACO1
LQIITPTNLLASIASTLSSPPLSLPILSFELAYVPTSPLAVVQEPGADDEALANGTAIAREEAEKYAELCTMLEAEDEVAKVWGNVEG